MDPSTQPPSNEYPPNKVLPPAALDGVTSWYQSKWLALVEFAAVALIFIADHHHLIPLSKTPFLLVLAWISLKARGCGGETSDSHVIEAGA